MKNEEHLIRRIVRAMPATKRGGRLAHRTDILRLGIGDDAAIIAPRLGKDWVLSCDAFLEGVHFLPDVHPPDAVGWKALVRAASDLAAMGATPLLFFLTLALPGDKTGKWLDAFTRGMGRAARTLGMTLAGGDTTANSKVTISITVLGEVRRGKEVRRAGARPGDIICVSGKLGGAELGLRVLRAGLGGRARYARLVRPHFYPPIRVGLGRWLARQGIASAMMDISDGLSTDLARLAGASGVGARIWSERLPRVAVPEELAKQRGFDPVELALYGGDDYELLFSIPKRKVRLLRGAPVAVKLTPIGEATREGRIVVVRENGREEILKAMGWDSFREA